MGLAGKTVGVIAKGLKYWEKYTKIIYRTPTPPPPSEDRHRGTKSELTEFINNTTFFKLTIYAFLIDIWRISTTQSLLLNFEFLQT